MAVNKRHYWSFKTPWYKKYMVFFWNNRVSENLFPKRKFLRTLSLVQQSQILVLRNVVYSALYESAFRFAISALIKKMKIFRFSVESMRLLWLNTVTQELLTCGPWTEELPEFSNPTFCLILWWKIAIK